MELVKFVFRTSTVFLLVETRPGARWKEARRHAAWRPGGAARDGGGAFGDQGLHDQGRLQLALRAGILATGIAKGPSLAAERTAYTADCDIDAVSAIVHASHSCRRRRVTALIVMHHG